MRHMQEQRLENGFFAGRAKMRDALRRWQPPDQGLFFARFGSRTLLMWTNPRTGCVEPFRAS